ncbi:long chain fatty alcohol oxidase-like protein [Rhexocercosporidium sp. MPI-PUGE-AT-0058]|nr:long chain fatty alcohol oxidase-like protein [Rhexocercosporidium sp. MPI-PUGE-AT-0058]
MSSKVIQVVGHLPTLLPDGPEEGPFTDANWITLLAIMDTVIPSITREKSTSSIESNQRTISEEEYQTTVTHLKETVVDPPNTKDLDEFLAERASDAPGFQQLLRRSLVFYAPEKARKGLGFILSALNTQLGSRILTGYTTPFHCQPILIREEILERWRLSYLPPLNVVYKSMAATAKNIWLRTSPTLPNVSGYPPIPEHFKPKSSHEYNFLQFPPGEEPETIETDVVIVGSGCGGAVCAKNLAEAGHRVLVADKGYHFPATQLPMTEEAGGIHLYENGGAVQSDDGSTVIVAGSSWGGGGTVNWSASLQTQNFVRKEWAQDRGLTFFETAGFQNCLDRVCDRMGASTEHIRHNHGNRVLLEGSRKLGYHAKAVPQNTGGTEHYCGHCTMGCGSGQKQGPVVAWLPDAAKAGAEFMEGFAVDHVIFDESSGVKKAVGVKGKWVSRNANGGVEGPLSGRTMREVIIRAKKVIISCGSLWSPIVLLNSGLTNPHIGRNLYLHPVNTINAVFKEDVRPWEGGILTSVCTTFENLDGLGHGAKLEATIMLPSLNLVLHNWTNGLQYKTAALKFRHTNGYISIARDRDPGRVYKDAISGCPRVQYTPSVFDRGNILEGVTALVKIAYVEGATEIHVANSGVKPFIRDASPSPEDVDIDAGITDPAFTAWVEDLKRIGNKPPMAAYASAHQMGSNRMSVLPQDGVVDPQGKVWGTEGLYVADASVFPSASGVNPMVTNMAIADFISRGVGRELSAEKDS